MESLPISALQHWFFCPRQCALIHVEREWADNRFTAEGHLLHERVDDGRAESRDGIRILRAVEIASQRQGLHGVANLVEIRNGVPFPVEFKRGRPKAHQADEVQLCAQALCLEEMTGRPVTEGTLFYGKNRRRKAVAIDDDLRALTCRVAQEVRAALETGTLPAPMFEPRKCATCSMHDHCRPQVLKEIRLHLADPQYCKVRCARMKILLNTLYVTTEGAFLRRDGETVAVEIEGIPRTRLQAHQLAQIVLFGETAMSRDMMAFAGEAGISVSWLT